MPGKRVVEIVYPENLRFQASLKEPVRVGRSKYHHCLDLTRGFSIEGSTRGSEIKQSQRCTHIQRVLCCGQCHCRARLRKLWPGGGLHLARSIGAQRLCFSPLSLGYFVTDVDIWQNISVSGKVAIARYGKGFRGNKAKLAEEKGNYEEH